GIENLSIAGSASFTEQRARMDDANITINEHNGIGALELMTRETGERILTATAAFDAVDLGKLAGPSWRELNRPFDPAGGVRKSMTGLNADIRISASMANVGALQLDNFAGAVSVRDEAISIDIGDASLAGGTLQLRYKDDATLSKDPVSLSVKGTDIDTSALPSEVSLGPLIPRGPISFTADLNGPSRVIRRALRSATGTISVSGQQGRLPGISVSDVLDTNDATQFFALAAEGGDGDIFDTFEADLTLADGAYRPEQIKVTYPSATLNVNGVISATNGSVAMTAILQEVEDGMIPPPPVFIGGTLLQPFATFILAPPDRIQ
ncbi:MAG: AsmA-like C-terminal region-containing protein, partial [Pseudomonadota bacterium]